MNIKQIKINITSIKMIAGKKELIEVEYNEHTLGFVIFLERKF